MIFECVKLVNLIKIYGYFVIKGHLGVCHFVNIAIRLVEMIKHQNGGKWITHNYSNDIHQYLHVYIS